jgi:hypothetical protein
VGGLRALPVRRAGVRSRPTAASGVPEGVGREPGVWKDRPRHDEASHGADAFLTFACSGYTLPSALPPRKRSFGWVVRSGNPGQRAAQFMAFLE